MSDRKKNLNDIVSEHYKNSGMKINDKIEEMIIYNEKNIHKLRNICSIIPECGVIVEKLTDHNQFDENCTTIDPQYYDFLGLYRHKDYYIEVGYGVRSDLISDPEYTTNICLDDEGLGEWFIEYYTKVIHKDDFDRTNVLKKLDLTCELIQFFSNFDKNSGKELLCEHMSELYDAMKKN